jgi:hypothetical protein
VIGIALIGIVLSLAVIGIGIALTLAVIGIGIVNPAQIKNEPATGP